jgi:hypothetical protein
VRRGGRRQRKKEVEPTRLAPVTAFFTGAGGQGGRRWFSAAAACGENGRKRRELARVREAAAWKGFDPARNEDSRPIRSSGCDHAAQVVAWARGDSSARAAGPRRWAEGQHTCWASLLAVESRAASLGRNA